MYAIEVSVTVKQASPVKSAFHPLQSPILSLLCVVCNISVNNGLLRFSRSQMKISEKNYLYLYYSHRILINQILRFDIDHFEIKTLTLKF